jgi:hypothetical protein
MKESVERMDSAALFIIAGRRELGLEQSRGFRLFVARMQAA